MGRRTLLLIASLLIAALGTALVYLYVQGADSRAKAGYDVGSVLVARETIPAGTAVTDILNGGSVPENFPVHSIPSDALTSRDQLNALRGETLQAQVPAGTPLRASDFAPKPPAPDLLGIPKGLMALSISLGDPQRVAGLLRTGSRVDIFDVTTAQGASGASSVLLVYGNMQVLTTGSQVTVPQPAPTAAGAGVSNAIITLEVSQQQAGDLLLAQKMGELYFTLLSSRDDPEATPTRTTYTTLSATNG